MDESRRCTATAKTTGERCKRAAIPGGNVCSVHGGKAQQVQDKAQERLDRMADEVTADMAEHVDDLLAEYERTDDPERKVVIMRELRQNWKLVLDRTEHGPSERREVENTGDEPISEIVVDFTDVDT